MTYKKNTYVFIIEYEDGHVVTYTIKGNGFIQAMNNIYRTILHKAVRVTLVKRREVPNG